MSMSNMSMSNMSMSNMSMSNAISMKSVLASAVSMLLLLTACGSAAKPTPAEAPTQAAALTEAATAAPMPTDEPIAKEPATEATATEAAAPAGDSLFARLTGVKKATSFTSRTSMQVTVFEMEQSYSAANSSTIIRNKEAGIDKVNEIEMRVVDGKTYMKGMLPTEGAAEQWIMLPGDQSKANQSAPVDAQQAIDSLSTNPKEAAGYKKTGTESIDGLTCDVYSTSQSGTTMLGLMAAYNEQFEKVTKAEIRIMMCPDGQMHQMRMEFAGTSKKLPGTPASIVLETRMYDFDKEITIEVPKNVMEMPAP
ncbi:MAG: hypothetical protein NTZ50_03335 [Chloroflexi bacterium]|nr:hypothetical protein [Chloroflexota bacterium]